MDNHLIYLVAGLTELLLRARISLDTRRYIVAKREEKDDWPERQPLISIERLIRQLQPLTIEEAFEALLHENFLAAEMVAQGLEFKAIVEVSTRRRLGVLRETCWRLRDEQTLQQLQSRMWEAGQMETWPDLRSLATFFFGFKSAHFPPEQRAMMSHTYRRWHQQGQEIASMSSGRLLSADEQNVACLMTCLEAMDKWRTRQP